MSQPTPYVPATEFAAFNPSSFPSMGTDVDVELANIQTSMDETQDRLELIQRDDGELRNGSVGPDQLENSVYSGINTPAAWVTATAYTVRDSVYFIVTGSLGYTKWYKCIVAHTSGVFATDLAALKWSLILEADPGPTGPTGGLQAANNLSELTGTAATARANIGIVPATTTSFGTMSTSQVKALDALGGKYTVVASGTTVATAFNRYRFTGAATITLPTFAADEWIIVEYGATNGTAVTVGRNAQTIDAVAADDTSTRYGDIVQYAYTSAGACITRHIGFLPS